MRARLPWALFIVSLALNLFFLAGYGYSVLRAERSAGDPEERIESVAERLSLSAEQVEALKALRESIRQGREARRQQIKDLRAELLTEIAKPQFDRPHVMSLISRRNDERSAFFLEVATGLHGFLTKLSSQQKSEFLKLAKEPGFLRGLLVGHRHNQE